MKSRSLIFELIAHILTYLAVLITLALMGLLSGVA